MSATPEAGDPLRDFRQGLDDLMAATRRLRGRDAKEAKGGLTFPQYRMLRALVDSETGLGEAGVRVSDLATEAGLTSATVGQMLEQLISRGLMTRTPSEADHRAVINRITAKGRRALDRKQSLVNTAFRRQFDELSNTHLMIGADIFARLAAYYDEL